MTSEKFAALKEWFATYVAGFSSAAVREQRNYDLKLRHTYNVCANMRAIAREHGLAGEALLTAEACALFHDLGRFRQFQQYGTFKDSISVNHAVLGAQLLEELAVLNELSPEEAQLISQTVKLHNVFALPERVSPPLALYLKLIRDADKLDIWQVFIDYYNAPEEERASAAALGFADTPGCSSRVLESVCSREMVHLSRLANLNDFKLLQISWVFDLNFATSFRLVAERGLLSRLAATLPRDEQMSKALEIVRKFCSEQGAELQMA